MADPTEIIQINRPTMTTILPTSDSMKNPMVTRIKATIAERTPVWRMGFLPSFAKRKLVNIVLVRLAEYKSTGIRVTRSGKIKDAI